MNCIHCNGAAHAAWCCEKAELDALRAAIDQTILDLRTEVRAPIRLSEDVLARRLIQVCHDRLSTLRSAA